MHIHSQFKHCLLQRTDVTHLHLIHFERFKSIDDVLEYVRDHADIDQASTIHATGCATGYYTNKIDAILGKMK